MLGYSKESARGHVFLCVLWVGYVESHLRQQLAPLVCVDPEREGGSGPTADSPVELVQISP